MDIKEAGKSAGSAAGGAAVGGAAWLVFGNLGIVGGGIATAATGGTFLVVGAAIGLTCWGIYKLGEKAGSGQK